MLPYQAVAMDYAGYQRQAVPGGHMGMGMSASPFGHSWLVPAQDICGVPYKSNQPSAMQTQPLEPGIIELRKEKSRDAARSRRNKENLEFYELAKMLPLPAAITSQLDKASIIRLSISYLKLRHFSGHGNPPWARENGGCSKVLKNPSMRRNHHIDNIEQHQGTNILQALDGFALAVAADGRFLYISETVSIYLGLSQVELTGSSIFDYIHQQDHEEIAEALGLKLTSTQNGSSSTGIASPSSGGSEEGQGGSHGTNNPDVAASMVFHPEKGYERSFAIRMKSTLTKRGVHFKSSGFRGAEDNSKSNGRGGKQTTSNNYALVLIQCRLRPQLSFSHTNKSQTPLLGMVGIAVVPPPPSIHEIRLESDMFVTRINFDFKIAHCEPRVTDLLDYLPEELVGKSLYNLCHAEDSSGLRKAHSDLINKGQSQTNYFRIMNKDGGFTWMQTIATVVCSLKNAEEQSIICINYVLSNREDSNLILDCCQLETKIEDIKNEDIKPDNSSGSPNGDPNAEGLPGPQGPIAEPQLISPKQENEPRSRRARNNNNIMQLGKDAKRDEILSPSSTPTQKRGQKRKMKADQEELSNLEPPKSSPSLLDRTRHPGLDDHSESSVKDLENAMSKHLPSPGSSTTDFSTDALLKQQQEKSSTIQWIGTPHYQQPGMPATALLRQLYANRESVIRATARQTPTGGVFYTDGQNGPLPTPPGSESSFDNQFLQLHSHGQKNSDAFTNLVSTYSGYHTSLDYHNAMTPPSSVSPRESGNTLTTMKNASQNPPPTTYDYGDPLRSQYVSPNQTIDVTGTNSTPALPLKPQPYSVAAMHHPDPSATYSNLEQSQYFSPHHSSFHLYHKGTSAVAPPPTSSGWYSTPS